MSSETATVNAYLQSKVMSASPEELRLMLIEGAIKFARQGRQGLESKDYEAVFEGFSRAKDIILELINGLRPEVAPELCERLKGLYTYMYTRLMDSSLEKDPTIADEVIELLEYDRQTWVMLMDQLRQERGEAGLPETPAPRPTGTDGSVPGSFGGGFIAEG
ncbi:MAG: flagellar export chaperone FliS [Planctomycetota bacterium]|jgi:flagellar protein FliS